MLVVVDCESLDASFAHLRYEKFGLEVLFVVDGKNLDIFKTEVEPLGKVSKGSQDKISFETVQRLNLAKSPGELGDQFGMFTRPYGVEIFITPEGEQEGIGVTTDYARPQNDCILFLFHRKIGV